MGYPTIHKALTGKLRGDDAVSWGTFCERCHNVVFEVGKYCGLKDDECNDLIRKVMFLFFKKTETFTFDPDIARFRTFFRKTASGKIVEIFRKRFKTIPDIPADIIDEINTADPEADLGRMFVSLR